MGMNSGGSDDGGMNNQPTKRRPDTLLEQGQGVDGRRGVVLGRCRQEQGEVPAQESGQPVG